MTTCLETFDDDGFLADVLNANVAFGDQDTSFPGPLGRCLTVP